MQKRVDLATAVSRWNDYDRIWRQLLDADERYATFGPHADLFIAKGVVAIGTPPRSIGAAMCCAGFGIGLVIDALGDPTGWTTWTAVWFAVLFMLAVAGCILASAAPTKRPTPYREHRYVITYDGVSVGVATISDDTNQGVCSFTLGLLPQFRGFRIGTYACRALLRTCFINFSARRVETSAFSGNLASLNMHDGMVQEGVLAQRATINGKPCDEILFRLLRSEWDAQIAARGDRP